MRQLRRVFSFILGSYEIGKLISLTANLLQEYTSILSLVLLILIGASKSAIKGTGWACLTQTFNQVRLCITF